MLKAALELMAEHGIDGTSMDAVARESGVNKATIYKHWADKQALLLEMLAEARGHDRPPRKQYARAALEIPWQCADGTRL